MKNILLIITKLSNGGAEKAITKLAQALKTYYNVTLVAFDGSNQEYQTDVKTIDLCTPHTNNLIKKIYYFFMRAYKIKKLKKDLKINCSISFLPGPNLVNCLTKCKEKVIISIRNTQSMLPKSRFRDLANIISCRKADKIVTVSDYVKNDISKLYNLNQKQFTTIYNMIDEKEVIDKSKQEIKEDLFDSKLITIITMGRLIPQKGQWHLIRAFEEVLKNYPKTQLIILGRGELEEKLKDLVKQKGIANKVNFLGFKENPYSYLSHSDIFVLPSIYEGMPNVILEAMAYGLPIIATDCKGGTREILEPNYGILVQSCGEKYLEQETLTEEEKQISEAIIELINDKEKRNFYSSKSKERIQDFSVENILQDWLRIIEE